MGGVGQWVKRVSWVNGWGGSMGEKGEVGQWVGWVNGWEGWGGSMGGVGQWVRRVRWVNGWEVCLEFVNCGHGEVFRSCELLARWGVQIMWTTVIMKRVIGWEGCSDHVNYWHGEEGNWVRRVFRSCELQRQWEGSMDEKGVQIMWTTAAVRINGWEGCSDHVNYSGGSDHASGWEGWGDMIGVVMPQLQYLQGEVSSQENDVYFMLTKPTKDLPLGPKHKIGT